MTDESRKSDDTPSPQGAEQAKDPKAEKAASKASNENNPDAPETEATQSGDEPALATQNAELKDQLLRTLADMENLRRRTQKQVKDSSAYAIANFARDILTVGDNLRRALDAIPEDARKTADATLSSLVEGMEMTEREMLRTLEKHGVKKLEPAGERFDPNFHQAMFEVPNPDVPNQTVVEVVQAGYVISDRVLRPAMVGVAKGGPKVQKAQPDETAAEASPAKGSDSATSGTDGTEPGATVDKTA